MASREETLLKIQTLKKQLSQSEELQRDCENLRETRSTLEKEIERLKEEIEKFELKSLIVNPKEKLLEKCLSKQREIDHRLDDLEEWTDEKVSMLRDELISLILQIHPEEKQSFDELSQNYHLLHQLDRILINTDHEVNKIIEFIEEALKVRAKVRKRSVLSYILGPNPNFLIAKNLQNIDQICEKMIIEFPDLSQNPGASKNLKLLYQSLEKLLKELSIHCKARWGFKTLDTTFTEAKENLQLFLESSALESKAVHTKLTAAEIQIDQWIEKYSYS